MPFTISHAAAVLPLYGWSKARLPLAALAVGSMSPDFIYFLPGDLMEIPTHNLAGLFWFCLPVGLAVWLLYVRVLELPTIALLPEQWRTRITPSNPELTLTTLTVTAAAIILGAITHIVWDSFTHRNSPVIDVLPALRTVVFEFGDGRRVRVYYLLQHLSTIVGFAVLMVWAWQRLRPVSGVAPVRESPHSPPISNGVRTGAVLLLFVISAAFALSGFTIHSDVRFVRRLFHLAIGGMTGWALAWCAVAIYIRWRWRRTDATATRLEL